MQMSNRIKEIIEVILNSKGYVTVGEIAKQINVSDRTEAIRESNVMLSSEKL